MPVGSIGTPIIETNGEFALIPLSAFTYAANYAFGMTGGNVNNITASTPYFDLVSLSNDNTGTATTTARRVHLVCNTRVVATTGYLTGTWVAGTFSVGETITQAVSGATGVIIKAQSGGTRFVFARTSGTFDNTHLITGGTSAATFTSGSTFTLLADYTNDELVDATPTLWIRGTLEDVIYQSDATVTFSVVAGWITNAGGASETSLAAVAVSCTNNSTAQYPKGVGGWASVDRQPINGNITLEVIGSHKYGNGQPFACCKITVTGQSSSKTLSATVTSMSKSTRADQLPVYAATFNVSTGNGFTRGELVLANFKLYPWIGDSGASLDATADAGTQVFQLGPLNLTVMDAVYAYADGVGAGTPAVSTVQATAELTPYANYAAAIAAIKAFNNSTYGLNRSDGGVVLLKAATYTWTKPTESTVNGYYTIQPASTATQANVIWAQGSADYHNKYQRMYNMTITRSAATFMFFALNGASGSINLLMENMNFNDSQAQGWYSGDTNTSVDFLDCTSNHGRFIKGGNDGHCRLVRNYTYTPTTDVGGIAGNCSLALGVKSSGSALTFWQPIATAGTNNVLLAYNNIVNNSGISIFTQNGQSTLSNIHVVCSVLEGVSMASQPIYTMETATISNFWLIQSTVVGQRDLHENNYAPTSVVNVTFTDYGWRNSVMTAFGDHQSDLRTANSGADILHAANMTGTWSTGYCIGSCNNHVESIAAIYQGQTDFYGVGCVTKSASTGSRVETRAGYVNDASYAGTNLGNGDYTPAPGSILLNRIPAGMAIMPFDINGVAIPNDGTGAIGAIQRPAAGAPVDYKTEGGFDP